jgi:hypothetical protein
MSEEENIPENKQKITSPADNENNSAKESVLSPQNTISVSQTKSSIMEVHKHPHHVTHQKKWGEYLLEFLMLFLAVFLGFIAENIRDNYVERQRAKEFAQSLYNDLKKDSATLNYFISLKLWRSKKLDSLNIVMNPSAIQESIPEAYYYSCVLVIPDLPFRPNDITIQQLRNSGTLRYFSISLYNRITQYYSDCSFYAERENENRQMMPPYSLTSKIFDEDLLASIFSSGFQPDIKNVIHRPDTKKEFKLLSSYKEVLNEYRLYVGKQKRGSNGMAMLLHHFVEQPLTELMTELKKDYAVN